MLPQVRGTVTATGNQKPNTLKEATALAHESRPLDTADTAAWLEYRRENVRLFRYVSVVDVAHHFEALAWVECEQKHANELLTRSNEEVDEVRDGP